MIPAKQIFAGAAAIAMTGVEVFCVYDGLKNANAATLVAGVGIATLGPLVGFFSQGRRIAGAVGFGLVMACVIMAGGSRVGGAIDRAQGERAQASRASQVAADTVGELKGLLDDARALAKKACADGKERMSGCTKANGRVDALTTQWTAAGTTLATAPVVAGEGDVARVTGWLNGLGIPATEHQVSIFLPLLLPATTAFLSTLFWGAAAPPRTPRSGWIALAWAWWRQSKKSAPVTAPAIPATAPDPVKTPIATPSVVDVKPVEPDHSPPGRSELMPVGNVKRYLLACVSRAKGEEVTGGAMYARYVRWCGDEGFSPMKPREFAEELKAIAGRTGMRLRIDGAKVYCRDVRLAA